MEDFKMAIDEARQFRNTAALCIYESQNRIYMPNITRDYPIPAVFNYSCGLEILMKAILIIENNPQEGHNLGVLFRRLKLKTKEFVKDNTKTSKFKTFEHSLKIHSQIYDDWRYIYEIRQMKGKRKEIKYNEVDFFFLRNFFNALDQSIYTFYSDRFK